jgi:hypothetical protein
MPSSATVVDHADYGVAMAIARREPAELEGVEFLSRRTRSPDQGHGPPVKKARHRRERKGADGKTNCTTRRRPS